MAIGESTTKQWKSLASPLLKYSTGLYLIFCPTHRYGQGDICKTPIGELLPFVDLSFGVIRSVSYLTYLPVLRLC